MKVALSAIHIAEGRRALRGVEELAESIREVGLLTPITLTTDHGLIAGLHRIEAVKLLGWSEIEAHIVELSSIDAQLAEIDENLVRNDLTPLERGEQLLRRKELYEAKHPETKMGGAPGKKGGGKSKTETVSTFADDAAEKLGVTPRTVRHEVQIARAIAPDVKEAIRDTPIAKSKRALVKIARLSPRKQRAAVKTLTAERTSKTRPARDREPLAASRAVREVLEGVRSASTVWQNRVVEWERVQQRDAIPAIKRNAGVLQKFNALVTELTDIISDCDPALHASV